MVDFDSRIVPQNVDEILKCFKPNKIFPVTQNISLLNMQLCLFSGRQMGGHVVKPANQLRARNIQAQFTCRETLSVVWTGCQIIMKIRPRSGVCMCPGDVSPESERRAETRLKEKRKRSEASEGSDVKLTQSVVSPV